MSYAKYKIVGMDLYQNIETKKKYTIQKIHLEEFCQVDYGQSICFFKNGFFHNECGPARIFYSENKILFVYYCLDGQEFSYEEWFKKISKEKRIKYLFNLNLDFKNES